MNLGQHLDRICQLVKAHAEPDEVVEQIEFVRDQVEAAMKIEAKLRKQIARDKKLHAKEVLEIKKVNAKEAAAVQESNRKKILALKRKQAKTIKALKQEQAKEIARICQAHSQEIAAVAKKHAAEIAEIRETHSQEIAALKNDFAKYKDDLNKCNMTPAEAEKARRDELRRQSVRLIPRKQH